MSSLTSMQNVKCQMSAMTDDKNKCLPNFLCISLKGKAAAIGSQEEPYVFGNGRVRRMGIAWLLVHIVH